jgi:ribosomal protein L24
LKGKSVLEGDEKGRMGKIVQLHGQIMDNINVIQKNTSRILIQQES